MKQKKLMLFLLVVLSFYAGLLPAQYVCPTPLPEQYRSLKPGNIFTAYFTSWDMYSVKYQVENIIPIADKITHLMYAFVKPDGQSGVCKLHDPWGDIGAVHGYETEVGGNFAKLIALKQQFPHMKILLSIGGGTYSKEFDQIAQSRKKLDLFAQSCVDMLDGYVHEYQNPDTKIKGSIRFDYTGLFDGLDIDWEWSAGFVTASQAKTYRYFMKKLRLLLLQKQKKTSKKYIVTSALQASPGIYMNLNVAEVASVVDWFHVMAYDFFGPNNALVGLNTPVCGRPAKYTVNGALHGIMSQGVSPHKLVLGIPSYGYVYENTRGKGRTFERTENTKAVSYAVIQEKYGRDVSFQRVWHDLERSSSLYNQDKKTFISFDDVASIETKVHFAKENRLRGVMLWKLAGDDKDHTLVRTITTHLHADS